VGYLYSLIAALLFGANGSITRVVIDAGLTPAQLTLFRVVAVTVISGAILLVTDRGAFRVRPRQLLVLAVLGIVGVALLQFTYAVAISLMPVGITLLIEYTAVLMVAVIAFVFFKESVKPRLWIAIALVLVGLAIVARVWSSDLDPVGVIVAFCAAITLTIYFVGGEREVGKTSPLAVAFWTMAFASAFWLVFSGWWTIDPGLFGSIVSLSGNLERIEVPFWMPLLANMVLGSFFAFFFSLLALRHLSATAAGIVASSEVIFAFIVAWLWLGEDLDPVQIVGAAIVLVGIVLAQTSRAGKVVDADLALAPARPVASLPDVGGPT
jgi:drug/metabolite transporter (DMT)-like permease